MAACSSELWLQPGKPATQGASLKKKGGVGVVLGAGNQGFLTIIDALDVLFVQNECCLVKHHPIREYNTTYFERVFQCLIEGGFMEQATCSTIEEASRLVNHPLVTHVHMTGGKPTHDAIVWGVGAEAESNKQAATPKLKAEMTSELGCITPWIVVPDGAWSAEEVEHHALQLVAGLTSNNSCNCLSPKMLVVDASWQHYTAFVSCIKEALKHRALVPPFYPGTTKRYNAFVENRPSNHTVECFEPAAIPADVSPEGQKHGAPLPWTILTVEEEGLAGKPIETAMAYALQNEPFAPILTVLALGSTAASSDASTFLPRAVELVNRKLFGRLSCTVLAHPETDKCLVEKALGDLEYGCVSLNAWSAQAVSCPMASWGAFPGETLEEVESGIGVVNNYLLYDYVEKTVFRTPFMEKAHIGTQGMPSPSLARALVAFLTRPGLGTFVGFMTADMTLPSSRPALLATASVAVLGGALLARRFLSSASQ